MAGRVILVLCVVVLVGASDIQDQIKQIQADIKSIQKELAEEDAFLRNTQAKVDRLEQLIAEAVADRDDASKSFILL